MALEIQDVRHIIMNVAKLIWGMMADCSSRSRRCWCWEWLLAQHCFLIADVSWGAYDPSSTQSILKKTELCSVFGWMMWGGMDGEWVELSKLHEKLVVAWQLLSLVEWVDYAEQRYWSRRRIQLQLNLAATCHISKLKGIPEEHKQREETMNKSQ